MRKVIDSWNSGPLSGCSCTMPNGSRPLIRSSPAPTALPLLPKIATRSLQPVAMSTICSVYTYSPEVDSPEWCTRSISKCPGSAISQLSLHIGTSLLCRFAPSGPFRGSCMPGRPICAIIRESVARLMLPSCPSSFVVSFNSPKPARCRADANSCGCSRSAQM